MKIFSLLFPCDSDKKEVAVSNNIFNDLSLTDILPCFSNKNSLLDTKTFLLQLLTYDINTITYRNDIIEDIINNSELNNVLISTYNDLVELEQFFKTPSNENMSLQKLFCIGEIDLFFSYILKIKAALESSCLKSAGLIQYLNIIKDYISDFDMCNLSKSIESLLLEFEIPKSITLGINLDYNGNASEAGIVAVNNNYYHSSNIIDKFLRLNLNHDEFECISELASIKGITKLEQQTLNTSIAASLDRIFVKLLKKANAYIESFLSKSFEILFSLKEIGFYTNCVALIERMRKNNFVMAKPVITDSSLELIDFYNLTLAQSTIDIGKQIVTNSIKTENNIIILTGPNSGGKSIYAKALGQIQFLLQIGMYLPCKSASLPVSDSIFTHFNSHEAKNNMGDFEAECQSIGSYLLRATDKSLLILNEAFNTTNYEDATAISQEFLKKECDKGTKIVFVTHLNKLYNNLDEYKSKITCLSSAVDNEGIQNYKFTTGNYIPKSLAHTIADKYSIV